jgi:hypothetical protein
MVYVSADELRSRNKHGAVVKGMDTSELKYFICARYLEYSRIAKGLVVVARRVVPDSNSIKRARISYRATSDDSDAIYPINSKTPKIEALNRYRRCLPVILYFQKTVNTKRTIQGPICVYP